jgi:hypothetical protein
MTCPTCADTGLLITVSVTTGLAAPAAASRAFALATSRAGIGSYIIRVRGSHPLVPGLNLAIEDNLIERFTVDGQFERLANPRILSKRRLGALAIGDIQYDPLIPPPGDGRELETGVFAHGFDVGRSNFGQVEPARLQIGESHRRVRDRQIDDAVELDSVLFPVIGKALEDNAVLCDALDESERARANRVRAEILARCLRHLGRHHCPCVEGKLGEQRRERRRQRDLCRFSACASYSIWRAEHGYRFPALIAVARSSMRGHSLIQSRAP